jgi:predicted Zn-dependent protease
VVSAFRTVGVAFVFGAILASQTPQAVPSEMDKEKLEALSARILQTVEERDGRLSDPTLNRYFEQVVNRLSSRVSLNIAVTRSNEDYAYLTPGGTLLLSAGLVTRMSDESDMAGLLLHLIAHTKQSPALKVSDAIRIYAPLCVLSDGPSPIGASRELRDRERAATLAAVVDLKSAGYDPAGVLSLMEKIADRNPLFGGIVFSDEMRALQLALRNESLPERGFQIDSSGWIDAQQRVSTAVCARTQQPPSLSR